jgi:iron complex outermembrane receptor protein
MTSVRFMLALAGSSLALAYAQAALAQDVPAPAPAAAPEDDTNQIIVTGTRVVGRTKLDTASPVDVLSGAALRQQGTTELSQALAAVAPSVDFPRPSATDGTDAIRPITLRGLSPDETLVLINGVRAHTAALLNINSSVGRGAAAVDLNTIPTVALETIEVLRDGASAQYGSDAIAGVVNLRLREARSGGGVSVTYGLYDTDVLPAASDRSVKGEHTVQASGWQGFGFGDDGFVTVSAEYLKRQPTNRADIDTRATAGNRVDGRFGDPEVKQYTGWINAGTSLTDHLKAYGWFGYQYRESTSAAFYRLPSAVSAVGLQSVYPNGFLPFIDSKSRDINSAIGLKGDVADWNFDLNVSYGRNKIDFRTLNSINYSFGPTSPKNFNDGSLTYDQLVAGLDVSRKFDVFKSLNVAFGVEGRREGFKIGAGDDASWAVGTYKFNGVTPGAGAQGFGGFSPANEVNKHRENVSVYGDVEAQITDKFLVGLAGRGEHYSDFGTTGTGKLSARYDITRWFALRGTASTGFRAPSLQQQYFTSTASVITNGVPVLTGTYPSTSQVGQIFGGLPLKPEKSTNLSVGTVIHGGGFDLTVDAYRIHIRDGLGLSENIAASVSPQVAAILAPLGVSQARFFINGIGSTTKGIDAVAHYRLKTDRVGTFDFTVAGNVNDIKVTHVPTSTATLNPAPTLFARQRILTIEDGTPGNKVTGTIDWSQGVIGATARITYYGNVIQPGSAIPTATVLSTDLETGHHAISDLELRYQPKRGAQIALGVQNLFDVYPKAASTRINTTGTVAYPYYSPFGFNGRYLYVRAGLTW